MATKKPRRTAFDVLGMTRDEAMINVLALYAESTDEQKETGRTWYERCDDIAIGLSIRFVKPHEIAAAVIAACSPQAPFLWSFVNKQCNLYRAVEIFTAQAQQRPLRKDGSCLSGREWDKAYAIANGDYQDFRDGLGSKVKVPSFYDSIINRGYGVPPCIDTHMICLTANRLMGANHPTVKGIFGNNNYCRDLQDLITEAAQTVGEYPQQMQAILWGTWKDKWGK